MPRSFPADDAQPPNLLADPPGRAVLAYHPREVFEDGGWATEQIFFLGADGGWRSLELVDLGLPESSWPGVDTYGAGALSYDGRVWAGRTQFGVVLVDLASGQSRSLEAPGSHTRTLAWRPDGHQVDMVRFSGKHTYRTWSADPRTEKVRRAPYRLPLTAYATDGTVATYTERDGTTQRVTHHPDGTSKTEPVPVPYDLVRYGALVGPTHTAIGHPRSNVVVDNAAMTPLARLAAPARTLGWLDAKRVLFSLQRTGLAIWHVDTGEVQMLTRIRPALQPDSWWSVAVAPDVLRRPPSCAKVGPACDPAPGGENE